MDNTQVGSARPPKFDLTNARIAYRWASDKDLKQAAFIYALMSWRWGMRWGSKLLSWSMRRGMPIISLVRPTLFRHFFAGEAIADCDTMRQKLARFGVGAIFDYAVEGAGDEPSFRASYEEILRTIPVAAEQQPGFAVFKMTALCSPSLLNKMSAGASLTPGEERALELLRKRIDHIAHECYDKNTAVLIDAEESWLQKAIDQLSWELVTTYNRLRPTVYLTFQMYRKDRLAYLQELSQKAKDAGCFLGVKLVRGAYLEQENRRAASMGIPSPIHQSKQDTDRAYDQGVRFCIENQGHIALFLGTHNIPSSLLLAELLTSKEYKPNPLAPPVFSQLLGMSDFLTFNLAKYGFKTYKYIPYGPIRESIPYLIRRAEENSAIDSQLPLERKLVCAELRQRKKQRADS